MAVAGSALINAALATQIPSRARGLAYTPRVLDVWARVRERMEIAQAEEILRP